MTDRTRCWFFILLLSMAQPLRAQELDAAVTWSCMPEKGEIVIHYYPSIAEAPPEAREGNPLVFYSLIQFDEDSATVTGSDKRKIVCQFKTDTIEVDLIAGVPNVNLLGMCGAAITGIISVTRNGASILTEEPFENINCFERERYIDTVIIRNGPAKPEIHHRTYDE